jgi:DNA-binding NtrC family response regulator
MSRPRILLLDDNPAFAGSLKRGLRTAFDVKIATSVAEAEATVDTTTELALVDVVLDEQTPGDRTGLQFLKWAVRERPDLPVVVLTGHGQDDLEVEALRLGAADYIEKGALKFGLLRAKLGALLARRRERLEAREMKSRLEAYEPSALVGESDAIHALRDLVCQLASSDATVFVTGESGAGKEVVARALHGAGPRRCGPFVAVNCAALSVGLLESELFGHEKGAFTHAFERRTGAFERANGGTLLLDEVTEIDVGLQAKLLRVLQEKQIQRVGGSDAVTVDIRIVATTNRVPEQAVGEGTLRQDLFYRLNVLRVELPPLRQHPDDVPLLAEHFLDLQRRRMATRVRRFAPRTLELLRAYSWPGNVRELENIVARACALCREEEIPGKLVAPWLNSSAPASASVLPDDDLDIERRSAVAQLEAISTALERAHGSKREAQKLLGFKDRSTMRRTVGRLRSAHPDLWQRFPALDGHYGGKMVSDHRL